MFTFQFLIQLDITNIFFSRFEGTRGEKQTNISLLSPKIEFENLTDVNDHAKSDHLKLSRKTRLKRKKYLEKTKDAIQCDYCTKLFNHKSNLKYHINKFHPDEVNRFDDEKEQVKLFDF